MQWFEENYSPDLCSELIFFKTIYSEGEMWIFSEYTDIKVTMF